MNSVHRARGGAPSPTPNQVLESNSLHHHSFEARRPAHPLGAVACPCRVASAAMAKGFQSKSKIVRLLLPQWQPLTRSRNGGRAWSLAR